MEFLRAHAATTEASHYRAYLLSHGGRVIQRHDFVSGDDSKAIQHARQYVDGHDVEVWQRERMITFLRHHQ
jgi:hypothetical protein